MPEITLLLIGFMLALILILAYLTPKLLHEKKDKEGEQIVVSSKCPICQSQLNIKRRSMRTLNTLEMGMVVQQRPDLYNQPLSDYRCSSCSASLVFYMGEHQPQFVISNVGENQKSGSQCTQCKTRLLKPVWKKNTYENTLADAPLENEHGMVCPRCEAVCCLGCIKDATRNRTKDGSYLCPRCHRGPVEQVFHF